MASTLSVFTLSACGQKGNLYMPGDDDFKDRATLPEIVRRQFPDMPPARQPSSAPTPAEPTSGTR